MSEHSETTKAVDRPTMRVVTPQQFAEGYREKRGPFIYLRRFKKLGRTVDGNYIVREPS